jgi:hypothetical protein
MRATTTTTTVNITATTTTRRTSTGAQRRSLSVSLCRGGAGGFVVGLDETRRMIRTAATRTMRRLASTSSSSRTANVTANAMPPSGRGEGAAGTRAVGVNQQQNQNQNNQPFAAGSRGNPVRGTPPLPPPGRPTTTTTTTTTQGQGYQTPVPNGRAGGGLGAVIPEEIDAVYHQMQHLGTKWADAHAEAEMLEEAKKCVLATITLHYISDGGTKAAAEVQAYASQEYQDHVKKMVEARRKANLAKIELESVKTHLNLTRTYEASRREEMKLL